MYFFNYRYEIPPEFLWSLLWTYGGFGINLHEIPKREVSRNSAAEFRISLPLYRDKCQFDPFFSDFADFL